MNSPSHRDAYRVMAEDLEVEEASRMEGENRDGGRTPRLSTTLAQVNYIGIHLMSDGSSSKDVECN